MEMLKLFLCICLYVCAAIEPTVQQGWFDYDYDTEDDCPQPTLKENLDNNKYEGLWFEIESFPDVHEKVTKCVTQKYTWRDTYKDHRDDKVRHVGNYGVKKNGLNEEGNEVQQELSLLVEIYEEPQNNSAHLTVFGQNVTDISYKIIDTDYQNYACVYSCTGKALGLEYSWVFGRAPSIPQKFIEKCHSKFSELNPDIPTMNEIVQTDECPYWGNLAKMLEDSKAQLSGSQAIDEMLANLASGTASKGTVKATVKKDTSAAKANTASVSAVKTESSSSTSEDTSSAAHMVSLSYLPTLLIAASLTTFMH